MSTTRSPHPKGTDMTTMLKLTTLGALLACAGVAGAANAKPTASPDYPPGPVRINPQPLPPGCPGCIRRHDGTGSLGAGQASEPRALPAPFLVAPGCVNGCRDPRLFGGEDADSHSGALSYARSTAEGSPLRLAGGDPPTVVDACSSRTCRS